MIDGASSNNVRTVRRRDIPMSDKDILDRYLNLPRVPCTITSPFRGNDRNPSFRIWNRQDRIYYRDFGTGEHGTVVGLLARMWNIDYHQAVERIAEDTALPVPQSSLVRRYTGRVKLGGGSTIKVTVRKWKKYDIEFWKSFGISQKMLEFCKVYPISQIFFEKKGEPTTTVRADKYAYAYYEFKDDKCTIKVYQPYSERLKWLSSHDKSTWDLWTQAMMWAEKKGDEECIITSSRKDAMCLWQQLNVPAVSLQGEGYIPKPQVMKQLLKKFRHVYIWYDNDFCHEDGTNPGQDNAKKLCELYPQLHNICIPAIYKAKDPSDLYKSWGEMILKTIWNDSKL